MKVRGPILWTLVIVVNLALLFLRIDHNLARAVAVQKCLGAECEAICDGTLDSTDIGTPVSERGYELHCNDTIFTDGFE